MNPFMMYANFIPLLEPKDIGTTITASSYMALKGAIRAGFLIPIGIITTASASDTEVVTVEAATAEGGTEAAIAFRYRLSGALGANTWGAVTTADTTGVAIESTDDNKLLWIEIDPDELAANDYTVVRVRLTDTDDMTAFLTCVIGVIEPSYKQTTFVSATASASA